MPEDCIAVKFDQEDNYWYYCWETTSPAPNWDASNVHTGLRKGIGSDARAWRTCQYYLNGLPSLCSHWDGANCGYVDSNTSDNPLNPAADIPTGFNNGLCDNLGRRSWCDKYEGDGAENLDTWICAAPNGYMTGLGERAEGHESPIVRVLTRSEITGYNDDGNGVGLCDCWGMGRGEAGCPIKEENKLLETPVVCNYYRPWSMGFGAVEPDRRDISGGEAVEMANALAAMDEPLDYRLPLSIELINNRARFQLCNFWSEDYSSDFILYNDTIILEDEAEGDPFDGDRISFCECTESDADPFNHRIDTDYRPGVFLTENITARGGGLICNGARPECPCYTGKWIHCTHEKMSIGMPVTANQILELRFWVTEWQSREMYDDFFDAKQNFDDPARTSDIYTFTKWDREKKDPTMIGKRLNLCFPIANQEKEYTRESLFVLDPITYAPAYIETGTTTTTQVHFPTLLRNQDFPTVRTLTGGFQYFNQGAVTPDCVEDDGGTGGKLQEFNPPKRSNSILGDSVTLIGQTIKNKNLYIINTTGFPVDAMIEQYSSMFLTPPALREYVTSKLINALYEALSSNTEYFSYSVSDSTFGSYVSQPVKLVYNTVNKMLIMVDFNDGTWEFRWSTVESQWCGGIIKQTKYKHKYSGFSTNKQPLLIDPPGTATFDVKALSNCTPVSLLSTYSFRSVDAINPLDYYSYSIITVGATSTDSTWWPISNTNLIGVQVNNLSINYIYGWEFLEAVATPTQEIIDKAEEKHEEPPAEVDLEEYTFDKNDPESTINKSTLAPGFVLLRPIHSDLIRQRFHPGEWELKIDYKYTKFTNDNVGSGDPGEEVKAGAGSASNAVYTAPPYELALIKDEGFAPGTNGISRGPINVMAEFVDEEGRLISTMATKACVNIVRESCRNIEIFYGYGAMGALTVLEPSTGDCIAQGTSVDTNRSACYNQEYPNCGDHDLNWTVWIGPNWFPFNSCRGYAMYNSWTICNYCFAGYLGPVVGRTGELAGGGAVMKRADYRYCGPEQYTAFGTVRGNWLSPCDCGCSFSHCDTSEATVIFRGYARIRSGGSIAGYLAAGFTPPPFGNDGRELVEKYISQDFIHHFYSGSKTRSAWMPMVMDNASFFMTFNAFDGDTENVYYSHRDDLDSFYYVNQMNFSLLSNISESIDTTQVPIPGSESTKTVNSRYRFDELFETHRESGCSYPLPAYPLGSGATEVVFYYFKIPTVTWAWQEYWVELGRGQELTLEDGVKIVESSGDSIIGATDDEIQAKANLLVAESGKLNFISSIDRPKYVFGYYKDEHRLICDEGLHSIRFQLGAIAAGVADNNIGSISIDGNARPSNLVRPRWWI